MTTTLATPYRTLIHLGCGAQPDLVAYRRLAEQVWLVEADAAAVAALEPLVQDDTQLHLRHAVVNVSARVAPFYRYSLPWANGLVALDEATQRLYPSLRCLAHDEVQTETVDALIGACLEHPGKAAPGAAEDTHLLILDVGRHNEALLRALEHSGELARFNTVVVIPAHRRDAPVAVPPSLHGPVEAPAGLKLHDNAQVLARHPLHEALQHARTRLEALTAERQQLTATYEALFKEKAALTAERDGLVKEMQTLSAECDSLAQANAAADKLAAERQIQLEALTTARQQLTAARDALTNEKALLTAERDGLAKEKQTLSVERDALAQAKAAAEQLAAEHQTQLEALTAHHQQLTAARDALAQGNAALTTERDTLKQTIAEVQQRQVLLEQELIKADAQIELIKDLLLREP